MKRRRDHTCNTTRCLIVLVNASNQSRIQSGLCLTEPKYGPTTMSRLKLAWSTSGLTSVYRASVRRFTDWHNHDHYSVSWMRTRDGKEEGKRGIRRDTGECNLTFAWQEAALGSRSSPGAVTCQHLDMLSCKVNEFTGFRYVFFANGRHQGTFAWTGLGGSAPERLSWQSSQSLTGQHLAPEPRFAPRVGNTHWRKWSCPLLLPRPD